MTPKLIPATVVLVLSLLFENAQGQVNWCAESPEHTLCLYPRPNVTCNNLVNGVNKTTQDRIVSLHNLIRARTAAGAESRSQNGRLPAARNMALLSWDEALATIAQRWTDQCRWDSDRNRNLQGGIYVGQNLYAKTDLVATFNADKDNLPEIGYWEQALSIWGQEVSSFNGSTSAVSSYAYAPAVGHYTQIVWAETTKIGCGFTQYQYSSTRVARILVCNYSPGGNRPGRPIYTPAASRSDAGRDCIIRNGYLCLPNGSGPIANPPPVIPGDGGGGNLDAGVVPDPDDPDHGSVILP